MPSPSIHSISVPSNLTASQLLQVMCEHRSIHIEGGWSVHIDEHGAWLTNPYGVDCKLIQQLTEQGAQWLLDFIEAGDKRSHEWGQL